jgi:opacity protein-like surface antigen
MRRLILAVAMAGAVQAAQAADMPDFPPLRGGLSEGLSRTVTIWQGYYVGGQAGYGSTDMNFANAHSGITARILANTAIESGMGVSQWPLALGKTSQRNSAFGAFAGYNAQWEDVVLGVEASYMHGSFAGSSSATMSRVSGSALGDGNYHAVSATSSSSMDITDMGTLRVRAGYAYENFLPYMFGGVALGNANIVRSVTVFDQWGTTPALARAATPAVVTGSEAQHNHLLYGYSAGVGVDMMLWGGLFARAEYEYVRFTGAVDTSVNTVRGGLGYKF